MNGRGGSVNGGWRVRRRADRDPGDPRRTTTRVQPGRIDDPPTSRPFSLGGVRLGNSTRRGDPSRLRFTDMPTLLAVATALSGVYVYNAWHTMRVFGERIVTNLNSIDPEVRFGAAEMLATEHGAVPASLLRSLDGAIPADVEHGVRVALTRRGVLAVAADATE